MHFPKLKIAYFNGGNPFNFFLPTYTQRCRSATEKSILEDLFSSFLSQSKKYDPSGNLIFNYLRIFQSLKLPTLMGKIFPISLKLNFTPNALGCYGLREYHHTHTNRLN